MTNKEFARTNDQFINACAKVAKINLFKDILPTKRQASKYRMRKGAAWKNAQFLVRKT